MAAAEERESDSAEPPGTETLLDEVLRTLYDLAPPSGAEVPDTNAVSLSAPENNSRLVEVVEFQSRSKRKPKPGQEEHAKDKTRALEKDVGIQEFNLEKARLEVHRFGITGYGKGKERVLERERAIVLGAKAPKRSYVNYKVLQQQIKEKRRAQEEEERLARDTDIFKKKKRKVQEDRWVVATDAGACMSAASQPSSYLLGPVKR
ncbi:hypothetical protein LTLLF_109910 [Microtus ochrogaster]|uniref:Uncharacterized protein n=1 Tax=Microtus ochrogaster TaxID=79684 RepID=A0A8J6L9E8_MICOH|nr:hypothetical protein LTLLF_109910 [Microtus ochrogaster]